MRSRAAGLLAVGLAACAGYSPTRVVLPRTPPDAVRDAVVRGIVRLYLGVSLRDLEGERFVSQALPDPSSPSARMRAFVRIVRTESAAHLEVTVARERLWTDPERPGWRIAGYDRDRERALADTIASFLPRAGGQGDR